MEVLFSENVSAMLKHVDFSGTVRIAMLRASVFVVFWAQSAVVVVENVMFIREAETDAREESCDMSDWKDDWALARVRRRAGGRR